MLIVFAIAALDKHEFARVSKKLQTPQGQAIAITQR